MIGRRAAMRRAFTNMVDEENGTVL